MPDSLNSAPTIDAATLAATPGPAATHVVAAAGTPVVLDVSGGRRLLQRRSAPCAT